MFFFNSRRDTPTIKKPFRELPDERIMTNPNTVFEIDWIHRDGTRIYATIKIDHSYNRIEDLGLVFDSFCEDLPSLLIHQDTSR